MGSERNLAIRVMLLPRDTNSWGTIFGGVILSYIDLAGAVEARRHTEWKVVTVAMDKIEFHEPVFVGDVVSLYTSLIRKGTTSLTIHVEVEAQRSSNLDKVVKVTEAEVVFVAVDRNRNKVPVDSRPSSAAEVAPEVGPGSVTGG